MDVACLAGFDYAACQVFDIFFCLLSISLVVLHHAPVTTEVLSAQAIIVIGVLVPAVVHNPTHSSTIVAGVLPSVFLFLYAWARYAMQVVSIMRGRRQRRCDLEGRSSGSSLGFSRGRLAYEDEEQEVEMAQRRCEGGQEREEEDGEGVGLITERKLSRRVLRDAIQATPQVDDDYASSTASFQEKGFQQLIRILIKELYNTVIGGFLALVGLAAFLHQSRDNYYLAHSAWHVTVMASTFFFVAGREAFIRNAKGIVHKMRSSTV